MKFYRSTDTDPQRVRYSRVYEIPEPAPRMSVQTLAQRLDAALQRSRVALSRYSANESELSLEERDRLAARRQHEQDQAASEAQRIRQERILARAMDGLRNGTFKGYDVHAAEVDRETKS